MKEIVNLLIKNKKTISTMESCTGGSFTNTITNVEGSSKVIKFGAVTYSNEFKVKMGVSQSIIDKYTVYSIETAINMSHAISKFTESNYSVGITGKLNTNDPSNDFGKDNRVFINIYDADNDKDYNIVIDLPKVNRLKCKQIINKNIKDKLLKILK